MTDQPNEAEAVAREIVEAAHRCTAHCHKVEDCSDSLKAATGRVLPIITRLLSQRDQRIAELEKEKADYLYASICTYCGYKVTDADPEARFNTMTAHIVQCEKHPLHEIPGLIAAKEAAEAQVAALQAERERLAGEVSSLKSELERRG